MVLLKDTTRCLRQESNLLTLKWRLPPELTGLHTFTVKRKANISDEKREFVLIASWGGRLGPVVMSLASQVKGSSRGVTSVGNHRNFCDRSLLF